MITRRKALQLLTGSAVAATSLGFAGQASAERVYNYAERRWVEYDPNVIRTDRRVPAKYGRRTVGVNTSYPVGTIVIDTDKKFLYHITGSGKATRYGVGVGREGFAWSGDATIKRKAKWPSWTPPAEMRERERKKGVILPVTQKGGIDNPLGARALYLYQGNRDTLYRIHGTNQPWSIGLNLSSGCIRMLNKDVEYLYEQVALGSKVVVIGPGQGSNGRFSERLSFFSMFN
ncbi:MAG: L,D-transpeptidase [Rhizobiaceae bacterium]|jgi:lipoprotein-anchoring transpeptidase ErfK/SrfK|nr:L,D-transpeptidase [Rhizobiaceae bacterium]